MAFLEANWLVLPRVPHVSGWSRRSADQSRAAVPFRVTVPCPHSLPSFLPQSASWAAPTHCVNTASQVSTTLWVPRSLPRTPSCSTHRPHPSPASCRRPCEGDFPRLPVFLTEPDDDSQLLCLPLPPTWKHVGQPPLVALPAGLFKGVL